MKAFDSAPRCVCLSRLGSPAHRWATTVRAIRDEQLILAQLRSKNSRGLSSTSLRPKIQRKHDHADRLIHSTNDRSICGHVWGRFGGSQNHLYINRNPSTVLILYALPTIFTPQARLVFFAFNALGIHRPTLTLTLISLVSSTENPPRPQILSAVVTLARLFESTPNLHGSPKELPQRTRSKSQVQFAFKP